MLSTKSSQASSLWGHIDSQNRRKVVQMVRLFLFSLVLFIGSTPCWSNEPDLPERPNILFLFADDFSYEAIGALGLVDIETPNLDRLYHSGTSFSHAYNMGSWSGAVCVASRCMLITGRTLWDANSIYQETDAEREAGRLWPQYLKQAGYQTFFTGKWHIRADATKAFDTALHIRPGMPNQTKTGYNRPLPGEPDPWDPADPIFGGFWKGGTHWSVVTANDAIKFIEETADTEAPFFAYVAFNAPHDPRQSPESDLARYPVDRIKLPENFLPEYPYKDGIGCSPSLRDERLGPFPRTEEAVKVHRREYFSIITHLDRQIGRVLDALEASGRADQTLVVFTADHGLAVGHHGLFGKQNMYDHSLRVPFVIAGAGIESGATIDAPIYLQDVMPTTLELAGVPIPEQVGFESLVPFLEGSVSAQPRESIYGAYLGLQRAIIEDGYKLVVYPKIKVTRLYHLDSDPGEAHDLAGDPAQRSRLESLYQSLKQQQRELGDSIDLDELVMN